MTDKEIAAEKSLQERKCSLFFFLSSFSEKSESEKYKTITDKTDKGAG